jgi:peptide/nickel transport system substrate-binding protein
MSHGNDDGGAGGPLRHVRRRDVLASLGGAGLAGLAGCSGSGDGTETADGAGETETDTSVPTTTTPTEAPEDATRSVGGTYTSVVSSDAESLNWLSIADNTSGAYIGLCLDGAWAIDPNQEVFPLWAEPSTDDGRVYEISLRENLQWGAGYGQMTAEDWVYMIQSTFQAEENWSGYAATDDWFATNPETGQREPIPVEKTGTYTFEVSLFEVEPSWPFTPAMWGQECLPKGLLEQYAESQDVEGLKQDEEVQTLAYAGNLGPYSYENWQRESQFVTTRNDDYYVRELDELGDAWREAPYFDRYVYRVIKEESARLGALEAGEVTDAGIPPNKASRFRSMDGVDLVVQPQPYVTVLAYNMRANGWTPFRRKAVRQALAHAVDKQALAEGVYRGFAEVAQTMQPKWSKWYGGDRITNYGVGDNYGTDVTMSALESALSDTEYEYDGERLVDGDGEQVTLSLYFDQGQETEKTTAEFVAQEFGRNAGIDVRLESTSSFIPKFAQNSPPEGTEPEWSAGAFNGGPRDVSTSAEQWDMSVNLGFNTYPYTPSSSKGFFETRGTINYYGYVPEADIASRYEEASRTIDEAERRELFRQAFGLINDEQPFGFLVMSSDIIGHQDRLVGPVPDFASGWNFQTYYFEDQ